MESMLTVPRTSRSLSIKAQRGGVDLIDPIADQWRALCLKGPNNGPFYRPEWISAYIRAFAPRRELLLITAEDGRGQLKAVLPLVRQRVFSCGAPVIKLRGAANVHSCRFDLIRASEPEGTAAVLAIWGFLKNCEAWDVIELPNVPQGGSADLLLSAAQKDGFPTGEWPSMDSPYIDLTGRDPKENALLIARDAHFRQNCRRRDRNLTAVTRTHLRRARIADADVLQAFYDLEASGWKGKKGTAIASSHETLQFYNEIAGSADHFGYLSLYSLELGNSIAAAAFGLSYAGRFYLVKIAYDETLKQFGPGHMLVAGILRDCLQERCSEFDFLGPSMEWKSEWAEHVRPHAHCYIFRRGLLGNTLCRITGQKFNITTALKRASRSAALASIRRCLSQRHSRLLPGRR